MPEGRNWTLGEKCVQCERGGQPCGPNERLERHNGRTPASIPQEPGFSRPLIHQESSPSNAASTERMETSRAVDLSLLGRPSTQRGDQKMPRARYDPSVAPHRKMPPPSPPSMGGPKNTAMGATALGSVGGNNRMFVCYTISEDRTGTQENVTRQRLSALGARCRKRNNEPQQFVRSKVRESTR